MTGHPYETYGNGICIHCGQIGSYAHTSPKERGELPMADETKTTTETETTKPEPPPEPETTTTTTTTEPADEDDEDA